MYAFVARITPDFLTTLKGQGIKTAEDIKEFLKGLKYEDKDMFSIEKAVQFDLTYEQLTKLSIPLLFNFVDQMKVKEGDDGVDNIGHFLERVRFADFNLMYTYCTGLLCL